MLFDLRSPHRRRVIKIVYVFLALLIGVGLVGFGIGNGSNFGGLFSNAGGGGGSATGAKLYTKALAKAEYVAGDLANRESVRKALEGVEGPIVAFVAGTSGGRRQHALNSIQHRRFQR